MSPVQARTLLGFLITTAIPLLVGIDAGVARIRGWIPIGREDGLLPVIGSLVGIALAVASLVIMPLVSWGKLRAAREIGSAALRAEAKETLACSFLSFTLLLGLAANAAAGWWWADPMAALLMVPWLVKEGLEGLRGETCEECEN